MRRDRAHPPVLKKFGQHFLTDRSALSAIADAALIDDDDLVVEVGPGRGALTEELLARAGRVIAIEIDRELAKRLVESYEAVPKITIVQDDFLKVNLATMVSSPFIVVGNVPYYITTPILFHTLEPPLPKRCVFLVQSEVADRITAKPGSKAYGALSVNVQALAKAERVRDVPRGAFSPVPKVDSAVVRITPLEQRLVIDDQLPSFREFVIAVFGMRRKQIGTILRSLRGLSQDQASSLLDSLGISSTARPETLSPEQFGRLSQIGQRSEDI